MPLYAARTPKIVPFLILLALLAASCAPVALPPSPVPPPLPVDVQPAIDRGLAFLKGQYNAELGLLQESPTIGRHNYYLTNDAVLAQRVFALYGEQALADSLARTLARYGVQGNGFIEAAWGEPVAWPPLHHSEPLVAAVNGDRILRIDHTGPGYFYDWSAYSNLAFMAAVNEWNSGHVEAARRLYTIEAGTFDGEGFPDGAYWQRDGVYETLGLAWGVYAAGLLCIRPDEALLRSLLLRQDPDGGGFHTHYRAAGGRLADPNVETTAVALLALHTIQQAGCQPPARLSLPAS